jgi:bacterioferritin
MTKKYVAELLNQARARELGVAFQYMRQHFLGKLYAGGGRSPTILEIFKEVAIEEMKHAERFAERIVHLGGTPTSEPEEIRKSATINDMIVDDLKSEEEAIELYQKAAISCDQEGDHVTRQLFEEILASEKDHKDTFRTLLGQKSAG